MIAVGARQSIICLAKKPAGNILPAASVLSIEALKMERKGYMLVALLVALVIF